MADVTPSVINEGTSNRDSVTQKAGISIDRRRSIGRAGNSVEPGATPAPARRSRPGVTPGSTDVAGRAHAIAETDWHRALRRQGCPRCRSAAPPPLTSPARRARNALGDGRHCCPGSQTGIGEAERANRRALQAESKPEGFQAARLVIRGMACHSRAR